MNGRRMLLSQRSGGQEFHWQHVQSNGPQRFGARCLVARSLAAQLAEVDDQASRLDEFASNLMGSIIAYTSGLVRAVLAKRQ